MPFRSAVYIVCSPRARVGRTLLARLLVDFFLDNGRPIAAFDLNSEPDLTRFIPSHAEAASIDDVTGQMALFDRLVEQDGVAKVVDVGPAALPEFLKVMRDTDCVEELRRRSIAPVLLLVTSPDKPSADTYSTMRRDFPRATLIPVTNLALGKVQYIYRFEANGGAALPLRMPLLLPALRRYAERQPFSFSAVAITSRPAIPLEARVQIEQWARQLFIEFRELELRLLLNGMQLSLKVR